MELHMQHQHQPANSVVVDRRNFSTTDDVAIFIDDTLDSATVRCVSNSPSAVAILSPQRLPAHGHHDRRSDVTQFDALYTTLGGAAADGYVAGMSGSARKRAHHRDRHGDNQPSRRWFASDVTNTPTHTATALFTTASAGCPTGTGTSCYQTPAGKRTSHMHRDAVHGVSPVAIGVPFTDDAGAPETEAEGVRHQLHLMSADASCGTSPSVAGLGGSAGYVPVAELERVDRERHRYQKMYEHQKTLYEEMASVQQETHQKLQDKIVEVVALSTRNEESKRFIRQLKREMLENRSRTLDLHNRQWEEQRQDKGAHVRFQETLERQESHFTTLLSQQEARMAGLEGLVRDLTALKGESVSLQVAQLDQLLKASYSKNAALFGDLMRVNRQLDLVGERKGELERMVEALRREIKDLERGVAMERRHMNSQCDRFMEQIGEQQQMILELRQCLVRSMASDTSSSGSGSGSDTEDLALPGCSSPDRCGDVVAVGDEGDAAAAVPYTNLLPTWRRRESTDDTVRMQLSEAASGESQGPMYTHFTVKPNRAVRESSVDADDDGAPPPTAEEAESRLLAAAGGDFVACSVGGGSVQPMPLSYQEHRPPLALPPTTSSGAAPFRPIRRLRAVPPPE